MLVLLRNAARWMAALVFTLLCAAVAAYAFAYLYLGHDLRNPFDARFVISGWIVPAHFFGAGVALLLAPLQLSAAVRARVPRLHRLSGGLYAGGVLVAGLAGLAMAPNSQGGLATGAGFALLAVTWLAVTGTGIGHAIAGDVARHRRWMLRSIALTSSAVTLRLMLAIGQGPMQLPFLPVYIFAAWTCWTFNLAVCEGLLRWPAIRARLVPARASAGADVFGG
ncbi:MAG TPA: DUF2306 domain-containing protein [Lysobacter sp.]